MAVIHIDTGDSKLWSMSGYSPDLFPYLQTLPLTHEPPARFGLQRRNVGFFSDVSEGYRYSQHLMSAIPLKDHSTLGWLLTEVNKSLGADFNGILVNEYVDGSKTVGKHSDDESGLSKNGRTMVAAIGYGATRTFRVRDKSTGQIVLDLPSVDRMLIVMEGKFQTHYEHEIPPQLKVKESRISVTFRNHTK